jgi:hypothetical protein
MDKTSEEPSYGAELTGERGECRCEKEASSGPGMIAPCRTGGGRHDAKSHGQVLRRFLPKDAKPMIVSIPPMIDRRDPRGRPSRNPSSRVPEAHVE